MANWQVPVSLQSAAHPPSDRVSGQNTYIGIGYALRVPAGITKVTVQLLGIARSCGISVTEWSGIVAYLPSDGSNFGGGTVANTAGASPTITTAKNKSLVVGGMNGGTTATGTITLNNAGSTPNTGWTALTGLLAGSQVGAAAYQIIATAAAGIQVAWTWINSTNWGGVTAAFLATDPTVAPVLVNQTESNFGSGVVDTVTIPATTEGNMLLVIVTQNAAATADLWSVSDNGPTAFPYINRVFAPRKIFSLRQFRPYISDQRQAFPITPSGSNIIATATDTIDALTDSAVRVAQSFSRTTSDSLPAFSDVATRLIASARTASDSIGATSDNAVRVALSRLRTATDSLSAISDTASRASQSFTRTASDSLNALSDSISRLIASSRTASDTLNAISEATVVFKGFARTASDSLSAITDSAIRNIQSFTRTTTDSPSTPTDSAIRNAQSFQRTSSDSVSTPSDSATRFTSFIRTASDSIGSLSDSTQRQLQSFLRTAQDTLAAISEATNVQTSGAQHLVRTAVDTIDAISDSALRQIQNFTRTSSDSISTPSDSTIRLVSSLRAISDSLAGISESTTRSVSHPRTASDSLNPISDIAGRAARSILRTALDILDAIIDVAIKFTGVPQFRTAITWSRDGIGQVQSRDGSGITWSRDGRGTITTMDEH